MTAKQRWFAELLERNPNLREALERFAEKHGRRWRAQLSAALMDGGPKDEPEIIGAAATIFNGIDGLRY